MTVIETQKELINAFDRLPLRMPQTRRELFQLFASYDPSRGLDSLLGRIDVGDVTPAWVYQVAHGRAPETVAAALANETYNAREHLRGAVLSTEFQTNVLKNILCCFPEKRRDVFIHVPKCAGTDLILNLASRRLGLPKMLEEEGWTTKLELIAAIAGIMQVMPHYDDLLVYGHIELGDYINRVGIRPGDRIFTVIRHPIEIMVSQANYATSRLWRDPEGNDPDTREIIEYLGLTALPERTADGDWKDVAIQCLRDPRITQPNRICTYLADKSSARYEVAMTNAVVHDVEITTTTRYARWLRDRWGIASTSRHNESTPFLTLSEGAVLFLGEYRDRIEEDRKFFDVLSWVLDRKGGPSVKGMEIAELVGPDLLGEFPQSLAAPRRRAVPIGVLPSDRSNGGVAGGIRVLEGYAAVARHLEAYSEPPGGTPELQIVFGLEGNSAPYLGHGWGKPEPRFTWTTASRSTIQLRVPGSACTRLLRLTAAPFVVRGSLPSQRIAIEVNGFEIGSATVRDATLIECTIPLKVLAENGSELTFACLLPDAARPCDFKRTPDDRLLAFAFEKLELFRLDREDEAARPDGPVPPAPGSQPAMQDDAEHREDELVRVGNEEGGPTKLEEVDEPELAVWLAPSIVVTNGSPGPTVIEPDQEIDRNPESSRAEIEQDRTICQSAMDLSRQEIIGPVAISNATAAAEDSAPARKFQQLMMRFESLGENCEFGLVQRRFDAEPLGLLRFSSTPLPNLLAALKARFEGMGQPDQVEAQLSSNGREYMVNEKRFGFLYHAWVLADEMAPEEIEARESRRLPFLIRKLIADLEEAQKIFVYHGMEPLDPSEAMELFAAMRVYGPSTLLWVEVADAEHAPGTVEWEAPGLLKAYIDRFAPGENAHDLSLDCWRVLCEEAYRLVATADAGTPAGAKPACAPIANSCAHER